VNRKQAVIGIVGIVIGFILGFFVAKGVTTPVQSGTGGQASTLPQDHPSPEVMAQVEQWANQAKQDPKDRETRLKLGNFFYDLGRFDAAIPWYEEALALDPSDVLVSTDLGTSYLYVGNVAKALEQYQQSLKIDPDHPQTLQNLGIAYFTTGEYQKAIDVWERLLKAHPDYQSAADVRDQVKAAQMHLGTQASAQ
jgi:tetratricopeptide (TPR) repeat protein